MPLFDLGRGESSRMSFRRARRLGRAWWRRRWPLRMMFFFFVCLVYLAFVGTRFLFQILHHQQVNEGAFTNYPEGDKVSYNQSSFSNAKLEDNLETLRQPRAKTRKHHVPCEVGFLESVDYLLEPHDYLNYSQFFLEYITKENVLEPRFGGHQTLEQRENSCYARDQTLHCGFIQGPAGKPSTGFDLSDKDAKYMAMCKVVVSSCIFGSSDFLRRPTKSKDMSLMTWETLVFGELL